MHRRYLFLLLLPAACGAGRVASDDATTLPAPPDSPAGDAPRPSPTAVDASAEDASGVPPRPPLARLVPPACRGVSPAPGWSTAMTTSAVLGDLVVSRDKIVVLGSTTTSTSVDFEVLASGDCGASLPRAARMPSLSISAVGGGSAFLTGTLATSLEGDVLVAVFAPQKNGTTYRSSDDGTTWKASAAYLAVRGESTAFVDVAPSGLLFSETGIGVPGTPEVFPWIIKRTGDDGKTFTDLDVAPAGAVPGDVYELARVRTALRIDARTVVVGGAAYSYRPEGYAGGIPMLRLTSDDGATWSSIPPPPDLRTRSSTTAAIAQRIVALADGSLVVATIVSATGTGNSTGEMWRLDLTPDLGKTWRTLPVPTFPASHRVRTFATSNDADDIIVLGVSDRLVGTQLVHSAGSLCTIPHGTNSCVAWPTALPPAALDAEEIRAVGNALLIRTTNGVIRYF